MLNLDSHFLDFALLLVKIGTFSCIFLVHSSLFAKGAKDGSQSHAISEGL